MSYRLTHLHREIDINKVLDKVSKQKRDGVYRNQTNFLFISVWDKWSQMLLDKLETKYSDDEASKDLYIINSFEMPHSFTIFGVRRAPALVRVRQKKVIVIDRLPQVYAELKVQ